MSGEKDPLTFDVKGLEQGQFYEFRVTAISDEGESEPLLTDCQIQAKNPFGKNRTEKQSSLTSGNSNGANLDSQRMMSINQCFRMTPHDFYINKFMYYFLPHSHSHDLFS